MSKEWDFNWLSKSNHLFNLACAGHALGAGYMFSRAWHRLHVFPRLARLHDDAKILSWFTHDKCGYLVSQWKLIPFYEFCNEMLYRSYVKVLIITKVFIKCKKAKNICGCVMILVFS